MLTLGFIGVRGLVLEGAESKKWRTSNFQVGLTKDIYIYIYLPLYIIWCYTLPEHYIYISLHSLPFEPISGIPVFDFKNGRLFFVVKKRRTSRRRRHVTWTIGELGMLWWFSKSSGGGWYWEDGRMGFPRQFLATVFHSRRVRLGTGISPEKGLWRGREFWTPQNGPKN